tara:strand:- start:1309 stop:2100 length:792 start_codon:yes stop_codon:yes gene_type:complete
MVTKLKLKRMREKVLKEIAKVEYDDRNTKWVIDKIREHNDADIPLQLGKPDGKASGEWSKRANLEEIAQNERKYDPRFPPGKQLVTKIVRKLRHDERVKCKKEKDDYGIPKLEGGILVLIKQDSLKISQSEIQTQTQIMQAVLNNLEKKCNDKKKFEKLDLIKWVRVRNELSFILGEFLLKASKTKTIGSGNLDYENLKMWIEDCDKKLKNMKKTQLKLGWGQKVPATKNTTRFDQGVERVEKTIYEKINDLILENAKIRLPN